MADRIKGITIEIGGDTTGLNKALGGVNKEIRNTQSQLKDVERLLKLDPSNTELLKQKQKLLAEAVGETKDKLETLKEAEKQAQNQFKEGKISEAQYNALKREIIDTEQKLKTLEDQAGKANAVIQQIGNAGGHVKEFGAKVTDAGKALLPVTGAITAVGGASAKMAMDFEDAMAKVDTIADTSQVPLSNLEQAILDLSNQTGISSAEIADNVYNAISAGQETGDAVNFVSNSTKLAKAGFADAGSALDILTTIMNAYGLEASEVNKVSDILIQTQNLGKTTVGELSTAMGKVIPTAKANGVALDQVAAGYAIMTANGVATAETTTYMNSMLNELGKSGTKVSETLKKKTGKSFKELMDGGASLADVLDIVSDSADEQGLAFGDLWGSAEAGKAALILLGDSADGFNGTLKEMQDSTGATETAFGKLDTKSYELQKTVNQLKNDAIIMGRSILDTLAPILEQLSRKIQELHRWFNNLDEGQRETIVVIGLLVAALGPLLITIGKLSMGIGAIMQIIPALSGAMMALSASGGPLFLVAIAVGAVAGAFVLAKDEASEYYEKARELSEAEQENKDKVESLKASYDNLSQRRKESIADIDSQAQHESALWEELKNITNENGKVKKGYEERAAFITSALSDALGIEIQMNDGIIQGYKDIQKEIDGLIEKKRAEATLNAYQESYNEALGKQKDARDALYKATKDSETATKEYNDALAREAELQSLCKDAAEEFAKKYNDAGLARKVGELRVQLAQAGDTAAGFKERMDGNNQTLADAKQRIEDYNTVIANYEGASAAIITGDQEKISHALMLLKNDFKTAETATKESLQAQHETIRTELANARAAMAEGTPGITSEYIAGLEKLELQSRAELGKLAITAGESVGDAAAAVRGKSQDMEAAGSDYTAGLVSGMQSQKSEVENTAGDIADAGAEATRQAWDSHSPSRVAKDIGEDYPAGLAEGITEGTSQVVEAVTQVAEAATATLETQLQQSGAAAQTYQSGMTTSWVAWASTLTATITTALTNIGIGTTTQLGALKTSFATETDVMSQDWDAKWTGIESRHKEAMTDIETLTNTVLKAIKALNKTETSQIKTESITTMSQMVEGIDAELKKLEPAVREGYEPAVKYITDLIPKAHQWGTDMMDGYIRGIREKIRELEDVCEDVAGTVSDYMHFTRPEKGPLRNYEEWMPHMMQGLAKGIRENQNLVTNQMKDLAADMAAIQMGGQQAKQPVNLTSYNVLTLDGRQMAEVVNEQLGILL